MKNLAFFIAFMLLFVRTYAQTFTNYAQGKQVTTYREIKNTVLLTDGSLISGPFRSDPKGESVAIDIDLTAEFKLGGIHLYFDSSINTLPASEFSFQYKNNGEWTNIPGTSRTHNFYSQIEIKFPKVISADLVRMVVHDVTSFGILEIQIWGTDVPSIPYGIEITEQEPFTTDKHWVCANQVAYNLNAPKSFTVPTAKNNLSFVIKEKESGKLVFTGKLKNSKGIFTDFNPTDSEGKEYVIHVEGDSLKPADSYPFAIGEHALQNMAYQPAVGFFNDVRSMVGSHPSAYGGTAWRDGCYYTYEVPSMVMLYLSNREVFDKMPVTLSWIKERDLVLSPEFKPTKEHNDKDALATVKAYYTSLPKPLTENIPDIIQCIRFGTGWNFLDPVSADPSGDLTGEKMHSQTIEQFAYFLYGYPAYKKYIPEEFYQMVLDSTLNWWAESDLFDVDTIIGNPKGRMCPGHSIMPNLLMFEVARREKLENAEKYMKSAYDQTQWIIDYADWNNPSFTKGQRISEHKLVTGLAHFQANYSNLAPAGLKQKLIDWAENAVSLSDNMWDFRKFDKEIWTLPGYNEAGNVIAFPGAALSVAMVLDEGELKGRLVELAYSHYDNFCGRNPQNAHCANHPDNGFEGVERGWPFGDSRRDICARLENVRGSLSSLPGSEMYPFNPNGKSRWGEGWTAFNADWNVSLTYLNFYEGVSSVSVLKYCPSN
jgi:hypothetical protein